MSSYKEGQTHQLANALEAAGFTSDDVTKLGQYKNLSDIPGLFRGTHKLKFVKYTIDCDANPFCPNGWKVEEHRKGGQLDWNSQKVQLYLSERQKGGKYVGGNELREELKDKAILNANVLDYLLSHPKFIPKKWKGKHICFWGTVYRRSGGNLFVRHLYWSGGGWRWSSYWLDDGFGGAFPAALLAG